MRRIVYLAAVVLAVAGLSAQEVYRSGDGVTLPVPVKQVKAGYTTAAQAARVEGTVVLEIVVRADGSVGDVKVVRSLDKETGLDDQAVGAMRQWEFRPGRKDDKPVAVRVYVEMTFTLK
jgi:protein TonB